MNKQHIFLDNLKSSISKEKACIILESSSCLQEDQVLAEIRFLFVVHHLFYLKLLVKIMET